MMIISHDRDLLDNAVNQILSLKRRKLTIYRGGYSDFERLRSETHGARPEDGQKAGRAAQTFAGFRRPLRAKAARRAKPNRASKCWPRCSRSMRW